MLIFDDMEICMLSLKQWETWFFSETQAASVTSASAFHAQYLQIGYQNNTISEPTPKKLQWSERSRLEVAWESPYFSKARIVLYRLYRKLLYSLQKQDSVTTRLYWEQQYLQTTPKTTHSKAERLQMQYKQK